MSRSPLLRVVRLLLVAGLVVASGAAVTNAVTGADDCTAGLGELLVSDEPSPMVSSFDELDPPARADQPQDARYWNNNLDQASTIEGFGPFGELAWAIPGEIGEDGEVNPPQIVGTGDGRVIVLERGANELDGGFGAELVGYPLDRSDGHWHRRFDGAGSSFEVADDRLLVKAVVGSSLQIAALDLDDGGVEWCRDVGRSTVVGSTRTTSWGAVGDDDLATLAVDGEAGGRTTVRRLNRESGDVVWTEELDEAASGMRVTGELVVVVGRRLGPEERELSDDAYSIVALSTIDGTEVWRWRPERAAVITLVGATDDRIVVNVGPDDGRDSQLVVLDLGGDVAWTVDTLPYYDEASIVSSGMVISQLEAEGSEIVAHDATDGRELWRADVPLYKLGRTERLIVGDDLVLGHEQLSLVDRESGREQTTEMYVWGLAEDDGSLIVGSPIAVFAFERNVADAE